MASGRTIKSVNARNNLDNSRCGYGRTIEDVSHEMEVERFYRNLIGEKYLSLHSGKSSRKLSSKTVQTDPNISGIPSSYLILGQKLVDELYTGLGNMINTLYHTPDGYWEGNAEQAKLDPKSMKLFAYENGYWHSKLHRDVKIPAAAVGVGREVHTANFKKELHSLLEKAVKLKNALPYIMEIEQGKDPQPIENIFKSCESEISRAEPETVKTHKEVNSSGNESCVSNRAGCSSDFSGKFDVHSSTSVVDLHGDKRTADSKEKECVPETLRQNTAGCDQKLACCVSECDSPSQEPISCVQVSATGASKKTCPHDGDSENIVERDCDGSGLVIISGKLAKGSKGDDNALAGCSNGALKIRNAGIRAVKVENSSLHDTCSEAENAYNLNKEKRCNGRGHNKADKTDGSNNDSKNFIKRNIMMASKMSARATTSKSVHDQKFIASHETGQQAKRNKK